MRPESAFGPPTRSGGAEAPEPALREVGVSGSFKDFPAPAPSSYAIWLISSHLPAAERKLSVLQARPNAKPDQ